MILLRFSIPQLHSVNHFACTVQTQSVVSTVVGAKVHAQCESADVSESRWPLMGRWMVLPSRPKKPLSLPHCHRDGILSNWNCLHRKASALQCCAKLRFPDLLLTHHHHQAPTALCLSANPSPHLLSAWKSDQISSYSSRLPTLPGGYRNFKTWFVGHLLLMPLTALA